jgi:hypothetical protein
VNADLDLTFAVVCTQKYDWGVEPREGYYWYLDGVYVLTKYGKRYGYHHLCLCHSHSC